MNDLRILGSACDDKNFIEFNYRGINFSHKTLQIFPGLCAVDNQKNVSQVFKKLKSLDISCARMGAYKPRTSPYSFQGLQKDCLPYVFEEAGKYGIKVIAMEVMHERHIDEINEALNLSGNPTGVMLQVGTRNAQNFELLKALGSQKTHPILYKRGFGISLQESLMAAEYIAKSGNEKIVFCLRGIKNFLDTEHRNLSDFSQISVIKRLSRMSVGIDPSHAIGHKQKDSDKISDLYHACAQGVISGANLILLDIHPEPNLAKVDCLQALNFRDLELIVNDIHIVREAYIKRLNLHKEP